MTLCLISQFAYSQDYIEPDSIVTIFITLPFNPEPKWVTCAVKDEIAYIEGDIVLGNINDLINNTEERSVYCDVCALWPNSTMPYVIGSGFSSQMVNEINLAINQINNSNYSINLCIVPRTNQADFIKFNPGGSCSSPIGKVGGEQIITLDDISVGSGCFKAEIIHEIFHSAGLWHEQSRQDRNSNVIINFQNIIPATVSNFDQHINDGFDLGSYDYFSIMHYGPYAFSSNGQPTITRLDGSTNLGQGNDPTIGDIRAINYLYGTKCGQCGISTSWALDDPVFHAEYPTSAIFFPLAPPGQVFTSGQFIKMDATQYYEISPVPGSLPTDIQQGCNMEIYIDGCYGN